MKIAVWEIRYKVGGHIGESKEHKVVLVRYFHRPQLIDIDYLLQLSYVVAAIADQLDHLVVNDDQEDHLGKERGQASQEGIVGLTLLVEVQCYWMSELIVLDKFGSQV